MTKIIDRLKAMNPVCKLANSHKIACSGLTELVGSRPLALAKVKTKDKK